MHNADVARSEDGFEKLRGFCDTASSYGYRYAWTDTCCINKESSAELTEAINSMHQWYGEGEVCYAFISDVDAGSFDTYSLERQINSSRWFTRGWTLQELLAPKRLIFFDKNWRAFGTRSELADLLSRRTGIPTKVLTGRWPLSHYSIAQRMSWAAERVTKRVEDLAYCLMGIFDVNMSLLYGEGSKAFLRLQKEIIEQSDDHTVFAWPLRGKSQGGLLADSPSAFANCGDIIERRSRGGHSSYRMTNRGLQPITGHTARDRHLPRELDCTAPDSYLTKATGFTLPLAIV